MRTGSWFMSAGMALIFIAALGAPRTGSERREVSERFEMQNVHTLDLKGLAALELDHVAEAELDYGYWWTPASTGVPISVEIHDGVLKLGSTREDMVFEGILKAPADSIRLIRSHSLPMPLMIRASVALDTLQLEGAALHWQRGNAAVLEVRLPPLAASHCNAEPRFKFDQGEVGMLRIHAPVGQVTLGDLSGVQDIELYLGSETQLQTLGTDLSRIRVKSWTEGEMPLPELDLDLHDCSELLDLLDGI